MRSSLLDSFANGISTWMLQAGGLTFLMPHLHKPNFDFLSDGLSDRSRFFQLFFLGSSKTGQIRKAPMEEGGESLEKC
jgi:hypothetical protein